MHEAEEEMRRRILEAIPDAEMTFQDLTGGGDHWQAVVISTTFGGQTRLARQRAIFAALGDMMHGRVHALTLTTTTPDQA